MLPPKKNLNVGRGVLDTPKKPPSDGGNTEEGGHSLDLFALDLSVQNKKITKTHSFLVFFHILLIDIVPP